MAQVSRVRLSGQFPANNLGLKQQMRTSSRAQYHCVPLTIFEMVQLLVDTST